MIAQSSTLAILPWGFSFESYVSYHRLNWQFFCCSHVSFLWGTPNCLLRSARAVLRQINVCLHLSRCRVALRPAVLSAARIWPSVSRYLKISFGLRGPSHQAFTPFGGGSSPGAWGSPNKGNVDGAVDIFGNAGCVWAPALRPDPPKKRPCATLAR